MKENSIEPCNRENHRIFRATTQPMQGHCERMNAATLSSPVQFPKFKKDHFGRALLMAPPRFPFT
jgi:hypothetical protein